MKSTLPGGEPRSIEDLLNDFEERFAGLISIARTTSNLNTILDERQGRAFLGMDDKTAQCVQSLADEYDELKALIFQRLDERDREKEPAGEASDV